MDSPTGNAVQVCKHMSTMVTTAHRQLQALCNPICGGSHGLATHCSRRASFCMSSCSFFWRKLGKYTTLGSVCSLADTLSVLLTTLW